MKFYNPHEKIGGYNALYAGLVVILISAAIGSWLNVHLNGNLQVALMPERGFWFTLAEHIAPWLVYSSLFFILGVVLSKSKIRFVDVAGSFALARVPFVLIVLTGIFAGREETMSKLFQAAIQNPGQGLGGVALSGGEIVFLIAYMAIILALFIWFIALIYHGYRISCNLSGTKLIVSFIAGIIVAEVLSQTLIQKIYAGF